MAAIDFTQVPYTPVFENGRQRIYRMPNNRGISVVGPIERRGLMYDVMTIKFPGPENLNWDSDPQVPGTFYARSTADIVDYLGWLANSTEFVSTVPEIMRPKR